MTAIVLPEMLPAQTASWLGLFDLADRMPDGWTLVGGQMVQLHCFERGFSPVRTTTDVDTVVHVREQPEALRSVTQALSEIGFVTDRAMSVNDINHRWRRDEAVIDVLIPRFLGPVASVRTDIHGAPGLETPGAQKQIDRSEQITVVIDDRSATINRPTIVGSLIGKASALLLHGDVRRHLEDFVVMAVLVQPEDFTKGAELNQLDIERLSNAIGRLRRDHPTIIALVDGGAVALDRLSTYLSRGPRPTQPAQRSIPAWATPTTKQTWVAPPRTS
ncbi:hypothetical protein V5D56_08940 [Cellulosimicrobium sp. PMB13]|uniref:hypothetical protein n=1 Tax=Cellulosimicrobium sp. PMB13 TaxID=3120158 RepID=UPI003F4AFCF1